MSSPYHLAIKGTFVIVGKEPDGDSVRFIANNPALYQNLRNAHRIRLSRDGSVQLRFEGIDAPELHYGTAAQPLGEVARDQLLDWMGFTNITFSANQPTMVTAALPAQGVPGAILTKAAEANGRPVSYALLDAAAAPLRDGRWTNVNAALLQQTLNFRLLRDGLAYYTVYTSTPADHRRRLRAAALAARNQNLGVWGRDMTPDFVLEDQTSIGPEGQLILPKLFRRCTDYLKAVAKGFSGDLADWLIASEATATRSENDRVVLNDSLELRLSDLLDQRNRHVVFQADTLDVVFVEK